MCLYESSKQLVQETGQPRPAGSGAPLAYDYKYPRNWVSILFMLYPTQEVHRQAQEVARRGQGQAHALRLGGASAETGG